LHLGLLQQTEFNVI